MDSPSEYPTRAHRDGATYGSTSPRRPLQNGSSGMASSGRRRHTIRLEAIARRLRILPRDLTASRCLAFAAEIGSQRPKARHGGMVSVVRWLAIGRDTPPTVSGLPLYELPDERVGPLTAISAEREHQAALGIEINVECLLGDEPPRLSIEQFLLQGAN